MTILHYMLSVLLGFLLGGMPSAYVAGRLRGIDVRAVGSGNIGATNALRALGWRWAVPVMGVDLVKGYAAAAWVPRIMSSGADPIYLAIASGGAAVVGHVFTPFLRFRGGKGVATAAGALLALVPWAALVCACVFAAVVGATRTVSAASLAAAGSLPLVVFLLGRYGGVVTPPPVLWLSLALAAFVFWTHRTNLRRLLAGTENRFGRKKEG